MFAENLQHLSLITWQISWCTVMEFALLSVLSKIGFEKVIPKYIATEITIKSIFTLLDTYGAAHL